jgi:predicted phosphodiesterase
VKLIHSADWQIGMRFRQFGARAGTLRAARVRTLRRALKHAANIGADAFLIAGDLFEDNQVDASTVREVFDLLGEFSAVPIFILPGNHDPIEGPGSVWARAPFTRPPAHITVFREPSSVAIAGGWLVANPLTQKKSTIDPALKLAELAAALPANAIKIGLTHGSPAIESQHQPDDFPIALNAATRAGLDYLAIGHWHSALTLDGGRLVMPGTPEPTKFEEAGAGCVQQVEIAMAGALPIVAPVRVAELRWQTFVFDFADLTAARTRLGQALATPGVPGRTVMRIVLSGDAAPAVVAEERAWLEAALAGCCVVQIADETALAISESELADLQSRHPLVAEVLEELRSLAAGWLSAPELQTWSERTAIPLEGLSASVAATAQRQLLRELREVAGEC